MGLRSLKIENKNKIFFFIKRLDFPDEYKLITKTDCQAEFLLKDCDLNLREPPLKFILKKNPHHKGWGEMKLYLRSQVKERAIMVHEDLDKLKEKKEEKLVNLHKTRQKNYEKKVKGKNDTLEIINLDKQIFFVDFIY